MNGFLFVKHDSTDNNDHDHYSLLLYKTCLRLETRICEIDTSFSSSCTSPDKNVGQLHGLC